MYLAAGMLLAISLACNLPSQPGPATSTPDMRNIVATQTGSQPTKSFPDETPGPTATITDAENDSASGEEPTITADGDIFDTVNIKDGNEAYEGKISFPEGDSSDEIQIKPVGFDSTVTSGSLVFTLTCSGEGNVKVNYRGGAIESGSSGCGESWTVAVVTGSADSQITIRLDDRGEIDWRLTVTGGG
jgi:hypothetical protein